ncbi:hypothetical protein N7466_001809 [Penicillium verhagenii]|uniref:uncharacterized protein n=1 Tax=Penicillium verhagenii TaxID=1562060 RepID=UPI0025457406|nr:uncharacterized protein N7466_001809 [Penicillium verhagenii]KAJ5938675.1 hypothetical protein N7466_001809 [Penicillium verhagenii]
MLSDTLSARSYLELGEVLAPRAETSQSSETPQSLESALETPLEGEDRSGPHLRPRKNPPAMPEKTEMGPDRPIPIRKRGRPRLETTKDAVAIEERRMQVRRAQRTYRQKKDTTIQTLKARVEVLEQTLQNVSNLLGPTDHNVNNKNATDTIGPSAHDYGRTKRLILAEINKTRSSSHEKSSANNNKYQQVIHNTETPENKWNMFGYNVFHTNDQVLESNPHRSRSRSRSIPRSPTPLLNRLFPTTTIYTYSNQESNLSRRLHRFCLEHIYRWLTDPHSDPGLMTRVFGLLPCIHDIPGVCRNFRRILQSEIGSPLEGTKLPFYVLGGAGTHFPRAESAMPGNVRRPGKILRRFAWILRRGGIRDWDEDWSGDAEPERPEISSPMSVEDRLRSLDLDGDWFDCYDVQGYLEHRGVVFDGSSLWLKVPARTVGDLYGVSSDGSAARVYGVNEASPNDMSGWRYLSQSTYVLDVECFFDLLLANLRILGRAPGFRLWDVDAALRTAIHRRSFG